MWAKSGGTAVFGIAGGPGLPGADPGLGDTLIQVATIGQSRTLGPNLLIDSVLGYERQGQHLNAQRLWDELRTAVRNSERERPGPAAERIYQHQHLRLHRLRRAELDAAVSH